MAHQRLLRPTSPAGEVVLADAFTRLDRSPAVWDVLLDGANTDERHRGADEAAFRLTYPFSPALVSTLRSLAGVMQRERTALKVMQQMLVDRRDTLTVDDVIPVGDTFDYVVEGREALDAQAAALFRSATALYRDTLRPLLLHAHDLTETQAVGDPSTLPAGFRADDRLVKTLLLSAVAPKVPALKEMTASRLASLNHGSIVSPLPGSEVSIVLAKVRDWAAQVPEIHVGAEGRNPVVRVRLSDVDYESVVERARGEDNDGRRRELLKDLVREAFGVATRDPDVFGVVTHPVVWRASAREIELVFGNVRDASWLTEEHFRARAGTWRFVVDHPFDEAGHSPAEDLARLDQLRAGGLTSHTVVWLPRFLSAERMRDLRRLVVLDWLLGGSGDRWAGHADHCPRSTGCRPARSWNPTGGRCVTCCAGRCRSPTAPRRRPTGRWSRTPLTTGCWSASTGVSCPPTRSALTCGRRSAISSTARSAPATPVIPGSNRPTPRSARGSWPSSPPTWKRPPPTGRGRVPVDVGDRTTVRRVVGPLRVGTAGETHFLFGDDQFGFWGTAFERAATLAGLSPRDRVQVNDVRSWINRLEPAMGLRPEVADLVIRAWAALRQRAWYLHGAPIPAPRPGALRPEMELRPEPLPTAADWDAAVRRVQPLFGLPVNPYLTSTGVDDLATRVRADVDDTLAAAAAALVERLRQAHLRLGIPTDDADGRLATARCAGDLVDRLRRAGDRVQVVRALAETRSTATDEALGTSLRTARQVADALAGYRWERLDPLLAVRAGADERGRAATRILHRQREAMTRDELSERLGPALAKAEDEVFQWLTPPPPPGPGPERERGPGPGCAAGRVRRGRHGDPAPVLNQVRRFLADHPDDEIEVTWQVLG